MSPREPLSHWTTEVKRAGYGVACAVLSLTLLLSAACGGGFETESGATLPDDAHTYPYPSATQLCGTETTWPDDVHFATAEHVIGRFKEKTGHALWRGEMEDIRGARKFIMVYDLLNEAYGSAFFAFGNFSLSVIDPRCPALIDWEEADGEPGPGGLAWQHRYVSDNSGAWGCWVGTKRYPRSNLVVSWEGYCGLSRRELDGRPLSPRWQRLDAVLREITRGR